MGPPSRRAWSGGGRRESAKSGSASKAAESASETTSARPGTMVLLARGRRCRHAVVACGADEEDCFILELCCEKDWQSTLVRYLYLPGGCQSPRHHQAALMPMLVNPEYQTGPNRSSNRPSRVSNSHPGYKRPSNSRRRHALSIPVGAASGATSTSGSGMRRRCTHHRSSRFFRPNTVLPYTVTSLCPCPCP